MKLVRGALPTLLLVAAAQVTFLWPMLQTGYLGDDSLNVDVDATAEQAGQSFVAWSWDSAWHWVTDFGRWFPLAFVQTYGEFHLIGDRLAYKLLLLVFVLVATLAVAALLLRLGVPAAGAGLVAVVATLCLQFRAYHDPVLAYVGLQQAVLAEVALSVLLFHVWLRGGRGPPLAGSIALMVIAGSTYESAPLLVALHLAVAVAERGGLGRGVRAAAPLLAVGAAFLVTSLVLRAIADDRLPGYEPRFAPGRVLGAFGDQVSGTIPLSHLAFDPAGLFSRDTLTPVSLGAVLAALAVGLLTLVLLRTRREPAPGEPRPSMPVGLLAALGALLLVLPAAPIAIATGYQDELRPGLAYLPVFVQAFGLGALAVALGSLVARRLDPARRRAAAAGASVLAGLVAGAGFQANVAVTDALARLGDTRVTTVEALDRGLLDRVPAGARVATVAEIPVYRAFLYRFTKVGYSPASATGRYAAMRADGATGSYLVLTARQSVVAPFGRGDTRVYESGKPRVARVRGADPDTVGRELPGAGDALLAGCTAVGAALPVSEAVCGTRGGVAVFNTSPRTRTLELRYALATVAGTKVSVDAGGRRTWLTAGAEPTAQRRRVVVPAGRSAAVTFRTRGVPIDAAGSRLRITAIALAEPSTG